MHDSCTFSRLVLWDVSQYGSFTVSSILCAFRQCTHLEAVCLEKDARGILASSCVFVRPFRNFGKPFSGTLLFTHKTIPGDLFSAACSFSFPTAQNISLPQQSFRRTFFQCFQLFARLTAFSSHDYPSTKLVKRSHEHYGRIVCIVCVS